jgi:PTS system cellobiose-specific IIC component
MDKFSSWMEEKLGPIAGKISANRGIMAISRSFTAILPVTMTGSLVTLVNYIRIGNLQETLAAAGITAAVNAIVAVTTNALALYLVTALGLVRGRDFVDESESRVVGFITLLVFLVMTPMTDGNFTHRYFGSAGLITAIIIGLIIPPLYKFLTEKGLAFHLPDSVPPFIADSFKAIPTTMVLVICGVLLNKVCNLVGYECLSALVMGTLGIPFKALSGSFFAMLILCFAVQLFWWFGIHGGMTVGSINSILFTPNTLENVAAGAEGKPLPHILTTGFGEICGGSLNQFACATAILFACKREDLRAIGKIGLIPSIFNISEPLRFGLPTVLNPYLFVPAVFSMPIAQIGGYILCSLGILARPRIASVFGTPIFLGAFMVGGVSALIYNIVVFIFYFLVWVIFLRMYENSRNKEDAELENM